MKMTSRFCARCGAVTEFSTRVPEQYVLCTPCFAIQVLLAAPAGAVTLTKDASGEILIGGLTLKRGAR